MANIFVENHEKSEVNFPNFMREVAIERVAKDLVKTCKILLSPSDYLGAPLASLDSKRMSDKLSYRLNAMSGDKVASRLIRMAKKLNGYC